MAFVGLPNPQNVPPPMTQHRNTEYLVRQGHYVTSDVPGYIDRSINRVAGTRTKVLLCQSLEMDTLGPVGSATDQTYHHFRTGATTVNVKAVMVMQPDDTFVSGFDSRLRWRIVEVGGSSDTEEYVYSNRVKSSPAPADLVTVEQTWTGLSPNTEYMAVIERRQRQRWVSYTVYEEYSPVLGVIGSPLAEVDTRRSRPGVEIRGQQFEDYWTACDNLWKLNGATIVSQSTLDSTSITTTSATNVGLYDNSVTAYGATNPGHYFHGEYKGSHDDSEVPCRLWFFGSVSGGGTATLTIEDSTGSIGTVTTTSSTPAYATADITIPATNRKIDPLIKTTAGTFTVFAWGLYEYLA